MSEMYWFHRERSEGLGLLSPGVGVLEGGGEQDAMLGPVEAGSVSFLGRGSAAQRCSVAAGRDGMPPACWR